MATISKRKRGGWEIQFVIDGKRKSFYPGVIPKREATQVKVHLEAIVSAHKAGLSMPDATALWLADRPEYQEKFHRLELVEAPSHHKECPALLSFVKSYIQSRSDVKASTITVWKRCQRHLERFFDEDRLLDSLTVGDAKDFRQYLVRQDLSENTIRKMCSVASQVFNDAIDRELIIRNPFQNKSIPRTTRANDSRQHFVTEEVSKRVLEFLPTIEWKLIFALSRWGGLRCPSEVLSLQWDHVLWDQKRIIVPSPKTEHHEGHEQRLIPLFPELEPLLSEAYHVAPEGQVKILSHHSNPGVTMRKFILKAGVNPWPKTFHNMRSTRQTELTEQYGIKAACAWLGNSIRVADANYLQVPDSTWDIASGGTANCTVESAGSTANHSEHERKRK